MKLLLALSLLATATAFVPSPSRVPWGVALKAEPASATSELGDDLAYQIAHKLRLQVYDPDTSVYGFESKDPELGIENIHTTVHIEPSLGLELTEVAHSDLDHRGLVLVSKVDGNARHDTPIHAGDVIIGVFAGEGFKESTTGLDYDDTVDIIERAKVHAQENGQNTITLELNRLVKRVKVNVEVEDKDGKVTNIEGLAGDNLRLLLMHHHAKLYDPKMPRLDQPNQTGDCGGEGICGTCLVAVKQGMDHLNKVGPQESSILSSVPSSWRAACKTVVGADNQEGTTLRIRLYPHTMKDDELQP